MAAHSGSIRILFFGTSSFAVPALEILAARGYAIAGVVTKPDEPAGRKRVLTAPPVKAAAERLGLPVLQPDGLTPAILPPADLYIVAAYGKLIPREILALPRLGALNIHPSLLPRWRGPSPIQYAILHGDAETGVTVMSMDEEMDHGPILTCLKFKVTSLKTTYTDLHDRLSQLGAELLADTLPKWIAGEIAPVPQDHRRATYSKMLTREDGRMDWQKPADALERMVRAFHPWPGAWTEWVRGGTPLRLRIEAADVTSAIPTNSVPGVAWQDDAGNLCIAAGAGSLIIQKIGAEGKNITDAASFVRGHQGIIGATLI